MSDAQEPRDLYDPSVPTLTEIVASGDAVRTREKPPAATTATATVAATGVESDEADAVVERLRARCQTWLAGEGRTVVEARCRAALQEQSDWLVGQITREVGLVLETELAGWVREAMRDEAASRPVSGT